MLLLAVFACDVALDSLYADCRDEALPACSSCVGDTHGLNPPQTAALGEPDVQAPVYLPSDIRIADLLLDKSVFRPPVVRA